MPYPRDMEESFAERYGSRAPEVMARYRNAHPDRFKKSLRTARRRGHGGVVMHSRYTKGRRKAKRHTHTRRHSTRR